jgi:hypothetical protein
MYRAPPRRPVGNHPDEALPRRVYREPTRGNAQHLKYCFDRMVLMTAAAVYAQMKTFDGGFFKPLLHLPKSTLVEYLKERQLPWREDASNQSREYQRNRVRLDLVPLLDEITEGALASRLQRLALESVDVKQMLDIEVEHDTVVCTSSGHPCSAGGYKLLLYCVW